MGARVWGRKKCEANVPWVLSFSVDGGNNLETVTVM